MDKKGIRLDINKLVRNKKLPILTLDERWHALFPDDEKTILIKELEHKVNALLKKQSRLVSDIKDMRKLKKNLMLDIVSNMDAISEPVGSSKNRKLDQNKQFIEELNQKLNKANDELAELPYIIKETNENLMIESMKICYNKLNNNRQELHKIIGDIVKEREELKKKILYKQDLDASNELIYTYMHDMFGVEIMEVFDKHNN